MLTHFCKIAFRNFWKYRVFSVLNVTGLAIGMAGALLLLLWIQNQLSIDQFHANKKDLYKVYTRENIDGQLECLPNTPALLAQTVKKDFPEVKNITRIQNASQLLRYADKKINCAGAFIDPAFLRMFSFPLLKGDIRTALENIHSIIITEQTAKRFFGNAEPMGKIIRIDNTDNYLVTGVLKDLPNNTQFQFTYLLPWSAGRNATGLSWNDRSAGTFIELQAGASLDNMNGKIGGLIKRQANRSAEAGIFLYPLGDLWLRARFENGRPAGGGIDTVRILGILAGIILLIACINFMNLSTARSERRAKEVGIRKASGASRSALIRQFIGESIFFAFVAGAFALYLVNLALPSFNRLTEKNLAIGYGTPSFWLQLICFIIFTGILAGSYPAWYLSSFKPVKVLKGLFKNGSGLITTRKALVVFQFVFSIVLINFTILLQRQMSHLQQREAGFTKENLVFQNTTEDLRRNYAMLKHDLLASGMVLAVTASNIPISNGAASIEELGWKGKDTTEKISFNLLTSQQDFIKTNGVQLVAGRDIDVTNYPTDTASCLINETAAHLMGRGDPLGQIITSGNAWLKIVGVVKDFITASPLQAVQPLLVRGSSEDNFIIIRLAPQLAGTDPVQAAVDILKKYNPNFPTELQFSDDTYARKIRGLILTYRLTNLFSWVAIFISCLGLFGLVTFTAESKVKEIGIRKVLGAGVATITVLLTKDLFKLVMLSIIIASPVAWLLMNAFLRPFYYRTVPSVWILVVAGLASLFIALITISLRAIQAARANPAKSLRTE
ncbi:MAG: transporter permease [Sediminibacterium sp.]|nr:transporter permease [Sediminibacterium sp.]